MSSLPQFAPSARELDDVELLRMGVLSPLDRFEESAEVALVVPAEVARWGRERGGIELTDPEGVPLAIVQVERTYPARGDDVGVVGRVTALPGTVSRPFGHLYVPPSVPRTELPDDTVTLVLEAPPTAADLEELDARLGSVPPLFLVLAGHGRAPQMSTPGLLRTAMTVAGRYSGSRVVAVPAARRDGVRRDRLFKEAVAEAYAPGPEILFAKRSGDLDPEVAAVVAADRPEGTDQGVVLLFTGLSGSGKSTIAQSLHNRLVESAARTVSFLDGDRVRRNLSRGLTFSREDRETNIERIGWVAAEAARHGGFAICSPIAPFERTRTFVREQAHQVGAAFVLIYVATPLEECERRDRKGLYGRARRGEIEHFTGISSPYEVPTDADLVIDTTGRTLEGELDEVLDHLIGRGLLDDSVRTECVSRPGETTASDDLSSDVSML